MALLQTNRTSWNGKTVLFIHGIGFQPVEYAQPLYEILRAEDPATADATRWHEVVYDAANEMMKRKIKEFEARIPAAGTAPDAKDLFADFFIDLLDYLVTSSLYHWINTYVRKALLEAIAEGQADGVLPADQHLTLISHSLGTVVAYESLHAIVNDPQVPGLSSGVRIQDWLTMGSPLAFIKARQSQIPSLNRNFFLRRGAIGRPQREDAFTGAWESNVVNWFNFQQKFDPVASLVPLTQASANNALTEETSVFDAFHAGPNPHDLRNYITEYKGWIMGRLRA